MNAFNRFLKNIQQDLKAFLFFCALFTLFRAVFIYTYSYQLSSFDELFTSLFLGARLSLKSAGWIAMISFVILGLPYVFARSYPADKLRKIWYCAAIIIIAILFFIKIDYYRVFNSGFDIMLINGAHDDAGAIMDTAVKEYGLLWKLPLCAAVSGFLMWLLCKILDLKTFTARNLSGAKLALSICVSVVFLAVFAVFVRYGGAFNYASSITWESAARLESNLLNEAVLDDLQALYRVKSIYKRSQNAINANISPEEIRAQIKLLGGVENATSIGAAFWREIKEKKLSQSPQNVIFILGETYALWPFLDEFKELNLTHYGSKFQASDKALSVDFMLAQGSGTMPSLNALLSGLADAGIYQNYEKQSFQSRYEGGIGYIMKSFGYKSVFWYGGFDGWQNIKNFALAQSFDEFHSSSEFKNTDGNSWGSSDKFLFDRVYEYMRAHKGEKIFHFILTTSNHPPFSVDVVKEGFDKERVKRVLPSSISGDDKTLNELGHIWYADKMMGEFIEKSEILLPDALFIITGDHAERFTFAKEMSQKTLSAVPCIFYGESLKGANLSVERFGNHIQIIPTLAELAGQNGYSSLLPSLFEPQNATFNYKFWADESVIEPLDKAPKSVQEISNAARMVTIWRVKNGEKTGE